MKNLLSILLLCGFLGVSCKKEKPADEAEFNWDSCPILLGDIFLPAEVTLCVGRTVTIQPGNLEITLTDVTEDSRCPTGVMCIWGGQAIVELFLHRESQQASIQLGTQNREDYEPNISENILGKKFTLSEVLPYPDISSGEIPKEDYRVKISVK